MTQEFPLLEKTTYLNTAYVGLTSKSFKQHLNASNEDFLNHADYYKNSGDITRERVESSLNSFFGIPKQQAFFVPGFSIGIQWVLERIPNDARFLLLEEDYPSLTHAVKARGFERRTVPIDENVEDSILKAMESRPVDFLALSLVQYTSGLLIDFEFLHHLKEKYPDLMIIGDGTQYIGGFPFDFDHSPFDVMVASAYKFMLAGFGCGVLAVSQTFLAQTKTTTQSLRDKIYMGHLNIAAASGLTFAIEQWNAWNFPRLMVSKAKLNQLLRKELKRIECLAPWIEKRPKHSSIYNIPGNESQYQSLINNNIRCIQRGNGIRIAIHVYNTEKDIHHLVDCLSDVF